MLKTFKSPENSRFLVIRWDGIIEVLVKILILNQVFYPDRVSTAQHSFDLAKYLVKQGHNVSVVCSSRNYEKPSLRYSPEETIDGIHVVRVASTGFGKAHFLGRVIDSISFECCLFLKLLSLRGFGVVLAMTSPPLIGLIGTLFARLRGIRCVQWQMDVQTDTAVEVGYVRRNSFLYKLVNLLFEFTLRYSDHVIVLDRWMKKRMIEHGVLEENISVIPPWPVNPVRTDRKNPSKEENTFIQENGLIGKTLILYSGNHSIVHPLDTLLNAARELKEDDKFRFVFIGAGIRTLEVKQFADKHGLSNVLQFPIQARDKLPHTLAAADIHIAVMGPNVSGLVHTSKVYGILGVGRPFIFIGPEKSHVVDLIADCPFGKHVNHGDVEQLVRLLKEVPKLTDSEVLRCEIEGPRFIAQNFDPTKCLRLFAAKLLEDNNNGLPPLFSPEPHKEAPLSAALRD